MFRSKSTFSKLSLVSSFILALIAIFFSFSAQAANSEHSREPIKVVTSFSILENLVQELGGNQVDIVNLVGRNADAHVYQPKPSDAVAIANADLVVMNGLGFEGWISRLMDNNDYKKGRLVASKGSEALLHGDEVDPHAWQSFENIRIYINNISETLIELKPEHQAEFIQRQRALTERVEALERDAVQKISQIPSAQRVVVTSHDAFGYLGREFDIQFLAPVGFNGDAQPTATDVATVIDQIHRLGVKALFVENISSPRLLERISAETNASIGGSLYSDALSEIDGPAATYMDMMRHNLDALIGALLPR